MNTYNRFSCRALTVLSALSCQWASHAWCQTSIPIDTGSRVRVTIRGSGGEPQTGMLARLTSDTLWLTPDHRADTIRVPVRTIKRLELSKGRRSAVGGALRGLLAGTML